MKGFVDHVKNRDAKFVSTLKVLIVLSQKYSTDLLYKTGNLTLCFENLLYLFTCKTCSINIFDHLLIITDMPTETF